MLKPLFGFFNLKTDSLLKSDLKLGLNCKEKDKNQVDDKIALGLG